MRIETWSCWVRVKIDKAEEQIPKPSPEQSLEQLLTQDDALRLAKETAVRSRERLGKRICRNYTRRLSLEFSLPALSAHLRVLREAGLANERRDGQRKLYTQ